MDQQPPNLIIDFDSTFISVEALDALCSICVCEAKRDSVLEEVRHITSLGMNGTISITESMERRLSLMSPNRQHLQALTKILQHKVTPSFQRNKAFIKANRNSIYIVSNGFAEFILPVVLPYSIRPDRVFANTFIVDAHNNISGFNRQNPLAAAKGKVKLVSQLDLKGQTIVIGDGYTDYEIKEAGLAEIFYAFTENVSREAVLSKTAYVAPHLDRIIMDLSGSSVDEVILSTL